MNLLQLRFPLDTLLSFLLRFLLLLCLQTNDIDNFALLHMFGSVTHQQQSLAILEPLFTDRLAMLMINRYCWVVYIF